MSKDIERECLLKDAYTITLFFDFSKARPLEIAIISIAIFKTFCYIVFGFSYEGSEEVEVPFFYIF